MKTPTITPNNSILIHEKYYKIDQLVLLIYVIRYCRIIRAICICQYNLGFIEEKIFVCTSEQNKSYCEKNEWYCIVQSNKK